MNVTRRSFLRGAAALTAAPLFARAGGAASAAPYEDGAGRASDAVMVRRLYLELGGRLPTVAEAQAYVSSSEPEKKPRLVDALLASDSFADYWSMRFCDILRVKSEFPINLWPNAVYVYHRRIRAFVREDEPWDAFARALLLSTGSDFRSPEANFFRATDRRTPEGFAEIAALTFLGENWSDAHPAEIASFADAFRSVRIKTTREWKEEIVFSDGPDRRTAFCDELVGPRRRDLAAGLAERVDRWMLARDRPDAAHVDALLRNGLRLKALVRTVALSDDFARGPVTGGFPCRRLDAEVLEDALCDLTGTKRDYRSIAPEPFTFLPPERRSVLIEDGSVSGPFLTLFGRPARDTGRLAERRNAITAKQRLHLFNSGALYRSLDALAKGDAASRKAPPEQRIARLYWTCLSRAPEDAETHRLAARFRALPKGRARQAFFRDLAWALVNSREFLYRH